MYCATKPLWRIYVTGSNRTYLGLHVRCPILLSDFNNMWIFSRDFHESRLSNFTKIRPVGAELIHADRLIYRRHDDAHKRILSAVNIRFYTLDKNYVNEMFHLFTHVNLQLIKFTGLVGRKYV